jgi:hypothetical protein
MTFETKPSVRERLTEQQRTLAIRLLLLLSNEADPQVLERWKLEALESGLTDEQVELLFCDCQNIQKENSPQPKEPK